MRKDKETKTERQKFIEAQLALGINFSATIKPCCQNNKSIEDMVQLATEMIKRINRKLLGTRFNKKKSEQVRGFYTVEGCEKTRHLHFAFAVQAPLIQKFAALLPPPLPSPHWPREEARRRSQEIKDSFIVNFVQKTYKSANVQGYEVNARGGSADQWVNYCMKHINSVEGSDRFGSF